MRNSKIAAISMIVGLGAAMSSLDRPSIGRGDDITDGLMEPKKKPIPPNHKEFNVRGITVTALSYKRAVKKVEKILANQKP